MRVLVVILTVAALGVGSGFLWYSVGGEAEVSEPLASVEGARLDAPLLDASLLDAPLIEGKVPGHRPETAPGGSPSPDSATTASAASVLDISFADLAAFDYVTEAEPLSEEEFAKRVPEAIRRLSGKRVSITGFMIPWKFMAGKIETFFLSSKLFNCCFGDVAGPSEVIEVRMKEGAKNLSFRPIVVTGVFEVGEVRDDYGYVMSVYRLEGDSVELE